MKFSAIIATLIFLFAFGTSYAQHEQYTLRTGGGLGYANLQGELGEGGSFGLGFSLDAKYYILDQLAVGGEYGGTFIGFGDSNSPFAVSAYGANNYWLKGEYYFLEGNFAPYAGLAFGVSRLTTPEIQVGTEVVPAEGTTNLGISPRVGLSFGNWSLEASYNLIGRTLETEIQNVASSDKPFNYLNIGIRWSYPFEL